MLDAPVLCVLKQKERSAYVRASGSCRSGLCRYSYVSGPGCWCNNASSVPPARHAERVRLAVSGSSVNIIQAAARVTKQSTLRRPGPWHGAVQRRAWQEYGCAAARQACVRMTSKKRRAQPDLAHVAVASSQLVRQSVAGTARMLRDLRDAGQLRAPSVPSYDALRAQPQAAAMRQGLPADGVTSHGRRHSLSMGGGSPYVFFF